MANKYATGKKSKKGHELVQRCRGAVLSALDLMDQRGKTISELLADELAENPIKFMELASKFCPREIDAEITNVYRASELADDDLAEIIRSGRSERAADETRGSDELH